MKTITFNGHEYQLINDKNVKRDKLVNTATFANVSESGMTYLLEYVWTYFENEVEVRYEMTGLSPNDIRTLLLSGLKVNPSSYEPIIEELKTFDPCEKCGVVDEIFQVEFSKIKYDGLCDKCLQDEMYHAGIGECQSCETITEVMEAKDAGVPVRGLYCEDCLIQMKQEFKEGA